MDTLKSRTTVFHPIELLKLEIANMEKIIQYKIIFDIYFKDDYDDYGIYLDTKNTSIIKDEYNDPIITYFNFINDIYEINQSCIH